MGKLNPRRHSSPGSTRSDASRFSGNARQSGLKKRDAPGARASVPRDDRPPPLKRGTHRGRPRSSTGGWYWWSDEACRAAPARPRRGRHPCERGRRATRACVSLPAPKRLGRACTGQPRVALTSPGARTAGAQGDAKRHGPPDDVWRARVEPAETRRELQCSYSHLIRPRFPKQAAAKPLKKPTLGFRGGTALTTPACTGPAATAAIHVWVIVPQRLLGSSVSALAEGSGGSAPPPR